MASSLCGNITVVQLCIILIATSITIRADVTTSKNISSIQLQYWRDNVNTKILQSILGKLSPLSLSESASIGSISSFDSKSCELANLACTPHMNHIGLLGLGYQVYKTSKRVQDYQQLDNSSFFRLSNLDVGKGIRLPKLNKIPQSSFLPFETANKISLHENYLQALFPGSFSDPMVKLNMETSISYCNSSSLGEKQICAKSLEEMIQFSKTALESIGYLSAFVSPHYSPQEFTIANVQKIDSDSRVVCHELFLPFATYYCHKTSSSHLFLVNFNNHQGNFFGTCHMDTAEWPPSHPAFKILNIAPGEGEACHWVTGNDVIFMTATDAVRANL